MIWIVSNIEEEHGPFITFNEYKKAFPEGEMEIYVANQFDYFSFLREDDVVIVRTRDRNIYNRLREARQKIGFKSTLETEEIRALTWDKETLKPLLAKAGCHFPKSVRIDEIVEGKTYFVKPRYGEDSIGVDARSKCSCMEEILKKSFQLERMGMEPVIEEYVKGEEVTTSLLSDPEERELAVYSSIMKPNNGLGFHTDEIKHDYAFTAQPYTGKRLEEVGRSVFEALGAKHYIRIDSRIMEGEPYIIDVNLIAGLNRRGYMAKCLEVNGVEYLDFIRKVVKTAS